MIALADLVPGRERRLRQSQDLERRQVRVVVPDAVGERAAGRWLYAGAAAAHACLGEQQPVAGDAPVLFRANLLDRVGPGEREGLERQRHHQPAGGDAERHQIGTGTTGPRLRHTFQAMTAAASAKPISSVSGTAATSSAAATNASARSGRPSGPRRKPTTVPPQSTIAVSALKVT